MITFNDNVLWKYHHMCKSRTPDVYNFYPHRRVLNKLNNLITKTLCMLKEYKEVSTKYKEYTTKVIMGILTNVYLEKITATIIMHLQKTTW